MNSLLETVDSQTVLLIAAIAVLLLLVRLIFRVLNVSSGLILTIVAVFLVLQYAFKISPQHLLHEISYLLRGVMRWANSLV